MKQTIKLKESQLRQLIRESIVKIQNEGKVVNNKPFLPDDLGTYNNPFDYETTIFDKNIGRGRGNLYITEIVLRKMFGNGKSEKGYTYKQIIDIVYNTYNEGEWVTLSKLLSRNELEEYDKTREQVRRYLEARQERSKLKADNTEHNDILTNRNTKAGIENSDDDSKESHMNYINQLRRLKKKKPIDFSKQSDIDPWDEYERQAEMHAEMGDPGWYERNASAFYDSKYGDDKLNESVKRAIRKILH
jgi:hypothetical protein